MADDVARIAKIVCQGYGFNMDEGSEPQRGSIAWGLNEAYLAGMREGETSKWISVEEKDKLPKEKIKVLMWFRDIDFGGVDYICFIGEIRDGHWRIQGGIGNFDDRVTHWQPLPSPPTIVPLSGATK